MIYWPYKSRINHTNCYPLFITHHYLPFLPLTLPLSSWLLTFCLGYPSSLTSPFDKKRRGRNPNWRDAKMSDDHGAVPVNRSFRKQQSGARVNKRKAKMLKEMAPTVCSPFPFSSLLPSPIHLFSCCQHPPLSLPYPFQSLCPPLWSIIAFVWH